MVRRSERTNENKISEIVLQLLSEHPHQEITQKEIRESIPKRINLTKGDMKDSLTRLGERLWEQIQRNIVSHKSSSKNIVKLGYVTVVSRGRLKLTEKGRDYLTGIKESK